MRKFVVLMLLLLALCFGGCTERIVVYNASKFTAAQPKFDPPGGTYHNDQIVSITCETEESEVYYTIDGSEPTKSSILFSEPIEVSKLTTIKARAYRKDWGDSKSSTSSYKFTVANPVFDPPGGAYIEGQSISVSCATPDAFIYYTTDGKEPTKSSTRYSKPITITKTTTLKAKAFKEDWLESDSVSVTFYYFLGVFVEGGSFQMGSNDYSDEKPIHTVTINSFYISKYELTQKEWIEVMGSNPSNWKGDNLPVEKVTWYNVIDYCNKRSLMEDLAPCYSINGNTNPSSWTTGTIVCNWNANGYRLPTEAEWEYAARGGNKSKGYTYSGSNNLNDVGWYSSNSGNKTHPVGEKQSNELGIFDMSGNVWEWCWDWYNGSYYSNSPQSNPKGPDSGSNRVVRGGSSYSSDGSCAVSYRYGSYPSGYDFNLGVRLVRVFP